MTSDGFEAEFMYRLLDYETWIIIHDGQHTGVVSINHVDRSVHTRGTAEGGDQAYVVGTHAYGWWRKWLLEHERPRLP
jgi:hypothetical protein